MNGDACVSRHVRLEKRSNVPFCDAIPNKNVTPTKVTNIELEKPLATSLVFTPISSVFPKRASKKAAPIEKKPILIFFTTPTAITATNTNKDICGRKILLLHPYV